MVKVEYNQHHSVITIVHPIPVCGFPPHTKKQFSDTSWVPSNSTQFWHYLPGDSIRPHELRIQSHKTAPHPQPWDARGKTKWFPMLLTNRLVRGSDVPFLVYD